MTPEKPQERYERLRLWQLAHKHGIGENIDAGHDKFSVCGCEWCYVCDSNPHECTCEDEVSA